MDDERTGTGPQLPAVTLRAGHNPDNAGSSSLMTFSSQRRGALALLLFFLVTTATAHGETAGARPHVVERVTPGVVEAAAGETTFTLSGRHLVDGLVVEVGGQSAVLDADDDGRSGTFVLAPDTGVWDVVVSHPSGGRPATLRKAILARGTLTDGGAAPCVDSAGGQVVHFRGRGMPADAVLLWGGEPVRPVIQNASFIVFETAPMPAGEITWTLQRGPAPTPADVSGTWTVRQASRQGRVTTLQERPAQWPRHERETGAIARKLLAAEPGALAGATWSGVTNGIHSSLVIIRPHPEQANALRIRHVPVSGRQARAAHGPPPHIDLALGNAAPGQVVANLMTKGGIVLAWTDPVSGSTKVALLSDLMTPASLKVVELDGCETQWQPVTAVAEAPATVFLATRTAVFAHPKGTTQIDRIAGHLTATGSVDGAGRAARFAGVTAMHYHDGVLYLRDGGRWRRLVRDVPAP